MIQLISKKIIDTDFWFLNKNEAADRKKIVDLIEKIRQLRS